MISRQQIKISQTQIIILISMLIVFGAANTIVLKIQNAQIVDGQKFFHPYIQCCGMFLGEALCIFVYIARIKCANIEQMNQLNQKPKAPKLLFAIPAILDFLASNISYFSLTLIPSSVWQISKGGVIITTAFFTRIFLKKSFNKSAYIGCFFAFIGITTVQMAAIFLSNNKNQTTQSALQMTFGIIMVIISLVFTGIQFAYQQHLFSKYKLDSFQLVGFEGIFGLIANLILVFILSMLQCPWQKKNCGGNKIESFGNYFKQLGQNSLLLGMCILQVFTIAISVSIAVTITKKINAVSRSLADVTRTVLIWVFGLIVTKFIGNTHPNYQFQSLNGKQIGIQGAGFIILIVGTLIYHDIISLKLRNQQDEQTLIKSGIFEQQYSLQHHRTSRQSLT